MAHPIGEPRTNIVKHIAVISNNDFAKQTPLTG
jgi:hypothetical protein